MTFRPLYDTFYPLPDSLFEVSSSVCGDSVVLLQNNLEWLYHMNCSEQIINGAWFYLQGDNIYFNKDNTSQSGSFEVPATSQLIQTFGPFRINLDKNGQPLPVMVMFDCHAMTRVRNTGSFGYYQDDISLYFAFRSDTKLGLTYLSEGVLFNDIQFAPLADLSSTVIRYLGTSSLGSGSICYPSFTNGKHSQLLTRVTQSTGRYDTSLTVGMFYLDVFAIRNSPFPATGSYFEQDFFVKNIFVREINEAEQ